MTTCTLHLSSNQIIGAVSSCRLYAIDRDKTSFQIYERTLSDFQDRLVPIHGMIATLPSDISYNLILYVGNFGDMDTLLAAHG